MASTATCSPLIADGRAMPVDKVRQLVDGGLDYLLAEDARGRRPYRLRRPSPGLRRRTEETLRRGHRDRHPPTAQEEMPKSIMEVWTEVMQLMNSAGGEEEHGPSVAIVYVEGPIMTGTAEVSPPSAALPVRSAQTIRKALDKAAEDDTVKAVVLRVDSPGGSALASEIILDASRRRCRA